MSIETRIVFSATLVPSTKLMKSVVSLRYDFCCCAIGWSSLSTNADNLSVGPETPEIMGLPAGVSLCIFCEGVENWNSRRILCLTKPFFSHFVYVLFSVKFCN